ncbi:monooxygenase [alpha proteobacterium AAP81b]|nr:monooxygenase [alpha proteobacterium AAP81b]
MILITGAGPTGLVLALGLARRGIPFRIVDRRPGPGLASRAIAVHARTLELYDQFGLADEIVAGGIPIRHIRLREAGMAVAAIDLAGMGGDLSPFPYLLSYPQDDHERFLVAELRRLGVAVEWNVELVDLRDAAEAVTVTLHHGHREEIADFAYVAGCDGSHSRVREALGIGFPGGSYGQLFYVADVELDGARDSDMVMNLGARSFALRMPVRSQESSRLVGLVPAALAGQADLGFEPLRRHVEGLLGVKVARVNWFSTYHVHHRVAERFRQGRCFLLGDAAHVHSPAGGQGMNTGIGDAMNLSWKLAGVGCRGACPTVLDSYEPERMAFAQSLVATTDRVFQAVVSPGVAGTALRMLIVPILFPVLTSIGVLQRTLFETVSQVKLHYPHSPLSRGEAGGIAGGDRLPWLAQPDNYAPLRSLAWQLHVHGDVDPRLVATASRLGVALHCWRWSEAAESAGYAANAAYLVRPDGYVGLAGADAGNLAGYVAAFKLDPTRRLPV